MSGLVNGVAPPAAANENHFIFEEDEVSRLTHGSKQYGLVIETSEFVSSDDEDYDDEEEEERVKKGSVRVVWYPDGEEQVIDEQALNLEDRSLMPGDVVRRLISGTNSQRGFVKDMKVFCDVQVIGRDRVIRGVDARKLIRAEEWEGDSQFVSLDSWVGRVEGVSTDIIVRFPDNSTMELRTVDMVSDAFNDVTDSKRGEDSEFRSKVFYEGQVLEETYRNVMEHDHEWITESKTYGRHHSKNCTKKVKMVVEEVNTRQLDIHWMCRGYAETEVPTAKLQMPPRTVEFEQMLKLKRLDYFEHCTVQIGDRAYLSKELTVDKRDTTNNNFTEGDAWNEEQITDENADENGTDDDKTDCCEGADKVEEFPRKDSIIRKRSKNANGTDDGEDADWETGSECEDQCPEKPKRKRTYSGSKHKAHGARTPQKRRRHRSKRLKWPEKLPVEILHTESYVDIMWQDGTVEEGIPSLDLYPIHHLDELEFFPGDFVIRSDSSKDEYGVVSRVDHQARTCWVKWVQPYVCGVTTKPVEGELVEVSVYDVKDHPDYKFRPDQIIVRVCCDEKTPECKEAAGQIVDIEPSGELLVCWADGTKSKAFPQDVFLISDETSDYGSSEWGSDEDEDESVCSWETEEEETETESEEGAEGEDPDIKPKKKKKEEEAETPKCGTEVGELMNLVVGDKMELDYQLDRLETALDNPYGIQPEVNERVVDCYRNVLTAYRQCMELDRLLSSAHFQDEELKSLISQVKKELRKEKQNRIQNQLLQQAQSCMNARKGSTDNVVDDVKPEDVDGAVGGAVPKAKSEPNLQTPARAPSLVIVKHSTDDSTVSVEAVSDVTAELNATLERARDVCTSVLKVLRKQVGKVREHLEGLYQKKLELMKEQEENEEKEELETASAQCGPGMMSPLSPDQSRFMPVFEERFAMTDTEPNQHNFYCREHTPQDAKTFSSAVRKEMKLLRSNLPAGIRVVGFEERMDLYSVLVVGPSCTPYEDGLFFFDVQLPNSYPAAPPTFHYISYCSDRLNPNLYDDGKVCVSLLGTWGGRGTELWSASSNMLQVLVSIQGLILNSEPYYNEAGYEKQRGSQMGMENSKVYNEMAILKLVQSMIKIFRNPPVVFKLEVAEHMKTNAVRMIQRLESWIELSEQFASRSCMEESSQNETRVQKPPANPDFPLIPASRGFCLTLKTHLSEFKNVLKTEGIMNSQNELKTEGIIS